MFNSLFINLNFAELHFSLIIVLVLMVIFLRNPIHALLCFIFAVINIISVFITFQAEFVALILFLVYVGAIAVLFLALIMFLNLSYLFYNEKEKNVTIFSYFEKIFIFIIFGLFLFLFQNQILNFYVLTPQVSYLGLNFLEIYSISYILYADLYFFIILSGILLFLTTVITMVYTTLPKVISFKFNKSLLHKKLIQ